MNYALTYIFILLPLAVIDAVWLSTMIGTYRTYLGHLFAEKANFIPVIIFYLIYTAGVYLFVVYPHLQASFIKVFLFGAAFGLVCYATYDLTNHATLKAWPTFITVTDMVWGSLLTGTTSVIAVWLTRLILK